MPIFSFGPTNCKCHQPGWKQGKKHSFILREAAAEQRQIDGSTQKVVFYGFLKPTFAGRKKPKFVSFMVVSLFQKVKVSSHICSVAHLYITVVAPTKPEEVKRQCQYFLLFIFPRKTAGKCKK